MSTPLAVCGEILLERHRQDSKWGEQNHPDILGGAADHFLPSATEARHGCDEAFRNGKGTWTQIAREEFCESIEEAARGDTAALRKELIQTAAVLVAWIEAIDRRPHGS